MRGNTVVVVGGGPCGLACASRLVELGHHQVLLLESAASPGGLVASMVDAAGFTWDRGGHVVFSHYGEFDGLLAEVMGEDVQHHERSSYVHIGGAWVPYPMQNNLHRLPPEMAEVALGGLISAQHRPRLTGDEGSDLDFDSWMLATIAPYVRP